MFSKTHRPWSLAARLSAWYAGAGVAVLLAASGFLYWALVASVSRQHDQYLGEKINVLRKLVPQLPGKSDVLEWEVEGESFSRPEERVLSRVVAPDGSVVAETEGMQRDLPVFVFSDSPDSGRAVRAAGHTYRILSGTAGVPGRLFRLQVAIDVAHERLLIAEYRKRLWMVLGIGVVATIFLGYHIGRRGARPVEAIAEAMKKLGSSTLDRRIDGAGYPAELSTLASSFNELLDRLQDSFYRLGRFSSDIAHELRTPVNNLQGEIEVALARARSADEYGEVLSSALEECQRLTRLIDSLLFLARAENPQTQIRREVLPVRRELESIREFNEPAASESGTSIAVDAGEEIQASIDRTLFQRAVGNLVENALAHTPAGGAVTLAAARSGDGVRVSVSDTGTGIPAEHVTQVFERFHRVDPARSKHSGGVGLGLAIVKSIALLHGGEVKLESSPGRGTTVTLILPA